MVNRGHVEISVRRQCELLGVNRSGLYYEPVGESEENLALMRLLDDRCWTIEECQFVSMAQQGS